MKKLSVLLFFLASYLSAQGTPDCQFKVTFTSAGTSPSSGPAGPFANFNAVTGGAPACVSWRVTYQTNAVSAVSVQIEGSPDQLVSGVHTATGSYTALTPGAGGGSGSGSTTNPATTTANGQIVACCDYYPWIRIKVNTLTSSGANTQIAVTVYGYKGTTASAGGGGGGGRGGTIAATTNTLRGDGLGNAVAVTGTASNCVFVDGTSGACTSTTGNAAASVIYTPGASVTLNCPTTTAGTVTTFSPGSILPASYTALAANMAITWAGCTPAQDIKLVVKQAAGGPFSVTGRPSGAPDISPFASAVTTYILHATTSTTVAFDAVSADSGPGVCTESAAPGTPPASTVYFWCDSTGANLQAKNPAGNISGTAFAKTAVANQPLLSFDPTTGLFTQGAVSGAPSGTAAGDLKGTYPNPQVKGATPTQDFIFTQNGVSAITSVETGAVVNTIYAKLGSVGFGTTTPLLIDASTSSGTTINLSNPSGQSSIVGQAASGGARFDFVALDSPANNRWVEFKNQSGLGKFASLLDDGSNFQVNNILVMDLNNGNIGIGNNSPGAKFDVTGSMRASTSTTSATYLTATNCTSSASPAVCASAASGTAVIAASATTVVVNTTAVTANSEIMITEDQGLGTKLSVTCNTQSLLVVGTPRVTARTAGTSFTVGVDVAPTANPICFSYTVVN